MDSDVGQGWVSVKVRKISEITRGDSGMPESLGEGSTCWDDMGVGRGAVLCLESPSEACLKYLGGAVCGHSDGQVGHVGCLSVSRRRF